MIAPPTSIAATKPLNDTGITTCGDYAYTPFPGAGSHNSDLDCSNQNPSPTQVDAGTEHAIYGGSPIPAGQDALYGRDANPNLNSDSDGHKGFSFTRFDVSGNEVNIDCSSYDNNPADGTLSPEEAQACYTATPWACVKDNVTGLIWEVKTNSGLQAHSHEYTWYNSKDGNHGGNTGIGDTGIKETTGYSPPDRGYTGSDKCHDPSRCDTEKYVEDMNAANSCAVASAGPWRLPTHEELLSIVHAGRMSPAIDTAYFPDTGPGHYVYWSSSPDANTWRNAWNLSLISGSLGATPKHMSYKVRLVRDSQ